MTILQIMPESGDSVLLRTEDPENIARELESFGVRFEQWPAASELDDDAGEEEVKLAYKPEIDRLTTEENYELVDVVRMRPDDNDPGWPEKAAQAREKFREEHRHDEDEVRFFVDGHGCFYLHLTDKVYAVVCESGDLLSVPVGTPHWFDMGQRPEFCAIRFFQKKDGWIGDFTGSPIAARFPSLDELREAHA
jgi:1,2-dihydroxy-3-keto-5-methylthiopentene dioxygenase